MAKRNLDAVADEGRHLAVIDMEVHNKTAIGPVLCSAAAANIVSAVLTLFGKDDLGQLLLTSISRRENP